MLKKYELVQEVYANTGVSERIDKVDNSEKDIYSRLTDIENKLDRLINASERTLKPYTGLEDCDDLIEIQSLNGALDFSVLNTRNYYLLDDKFILSYCHDKDVWNMNDKISSNYIRSFNRFKNINHLTYQGASNEVI